MTLYMTIGGRKAILQAMPGLKFRLEQDPCFDMGSIADGFEHSDDFTEFLIFLCGGAPFYDGKPICELLSPLCGCDDEYSRFVDHLVAVFFGDRSNPKDEAQLRQHMDRLRPQVLNPKPVRPVLVYAVEPEGLSV